jgi:hypothetical protein
MGYVVQNDELRKIKDRLFGKEYSIKSYVEGTKVENGYEINPLNQSFSFLLKIQCLEKFFFF